MIKTIEVKRHWNSPKIEVGMNDEKVYVHTDVESFISRAVDLAEAGIMAQGIPLDALKKEFLAAASVKKLRWSVREKTIIDTLEKDFDHGVLMSAVNLRKVIRAAVSESLEGIIQELKHETRRIA